MDTLRWGIVGPGTIARRFADQLRHSETGKLVAVASRDITRAQRFAALFDSYAHDSYADVLADRNVDAVYIATIHPEHVHLSIQALTAGKRVICEKPAATDSAGTMAIIETAHQCRRYFAEGYMYRFHPQMAQLREIIGSGDIGEVTHVSASFCFTADFPSDHWALRRDLAGGSILNVGGYPVSAARWVAGIAAGGSVRTTRLRGSGCVGDTGVDEWATALVEFDSGVTAHVVSGVQLRAPDGVTVYGSRGSVTLRNPWLPSPEEHPEIVLRRPGPGEKIFQAPSAYQYALEADAAARGDDVLEADEFPWEESLALSRDLESWRRDVGVRYPFEGEGANIPTASRRPLRRHPHAPMTYGTIPGVNPPVSRLIMGVDNQESLANMSVMLDDYVERGGTTFDTAHIYGGGVMERIFGRWVHNRNIRSDILIVGKGAVTPHCTPEGIVRQLGESLDRMGIDSVDLYLMHRDNMDVPVGEFVDVLNELTRLGKVKAFGGSNWTTERFVAAQAYARKTDQNGFCALSNHFGLAHALDVPWEGCIAMTDPKDRAWLCDTNTPLLPWSSQARGFFARGNPSETVDGELVRCFYSSENFERQSRCRMLATRWGVTPTAIALAYVLRQPFPTFPLIGPRTLAETRSSFEALRVDLSVEDIEWLDIRRESGELSGASPVP